MKLKIKWDEPVPKQNDPKERCIYATGANGVPRWSLTHHPKNNMEDLPWHLYCMNPHVHFSVLGKTYLEAKQNWIDQMRKHIEACQKLMADIESDKNV